MTDGQKYVEAPCVRDAFCDWQHRGRHFKNARTPGTESNNISCTQSLSHGTSGVDPCLTQAHLYSREQGCELTQISTEELIQKRRSWFGRVIPVWAYTYIYIYVIYVYVSKILLTVNDRTRQTTQALACIAIYGMSKVSSASCIRHVRVVWPIRLGITKYLDVFHSIRHMHTISPCSMRSAMMLRLLAERCPWLR